MEEVNALWRTVEPYFMAFFVPCAAAVVVICIVSMYRIRKYNSRPRVVMRLDVLARLAHDGTATVPPEGVSACVVTNTTRPTAAETALGGKCTFIGQSIRTTDGTDINAFVCSPYDPTVKLYLRLSKHTADIRGGWLLAVVTESHMPTVWWQEYIKQYVPLNIVPLQRESEGGGDSAESVPVDARPGRRWKTKRGGRA